MKNAVIGRSRPDAFSSDLPEIVRISDRILVMARKTIVWNKPNPGNYAAVSEEIMHSVV